MKRSEPPKRKTPLPRPAKHLKRSRLKQQKGRVKPRPEGHEEPEYLEWLRSQDCRVAVVTGVYPGCMYPVEAAHVGESGLSMKCPDRESLPLCGYHHRVDGHDHATAKGVLGFFGSMTKEARREWYEEQIAICRALYAADGGKL